MHRDASGGLQQSTRHTHLLCDQLLLSHCRDLGLCGLIQVALDPLHLLGKALLSLQAAPAAAPAASAHYCNMRHWLAALALRAPLNQPRHDSTLGIRQPPHSTKGKADRAGQVHRQDTGNGRR